MFDYFDMDSLTPKRITFFFRKLANVREGFIKYLQGVPKKMSLSKMLRGRIFLNTPSFSMDKMRRI